MYNPITKFLRKRRMEQRMSFLRQEREMIRKAMDRVAAASADVVEEIVDLPAVISQETGFMYRVTLAGADELYNAVTKYNYYKLANGLGHLEEDDEFLLAMIVLDKCEEYMDYDALAKAFSILEYVVRHNKSNSEVVSFARQYVIEMRAYLTELGYL